MGLAYWTVYRMNGNRYFQRQDVVRHAGQHGVRAAARFYACSRNTIRKWIRRARDEGSAGLHGRSRRPHRCPHQVPPDEERAIVALRRKTGAGAARLRYEWHVPRSECAIKRILRQHHLIQPRKRKHKTKKQLSAVKRLWPLFGQLCHDTKYLTDIPTYWPQMRRLGLPRFQYTVREVVSGLTFTGYADEISKTYATLMAELVCAHLAWCGVDLRTVTWQTDNGSEFKEDAQERGMPSAVRLLGCQHRYIPPKAHTWQSDVETVHRLQEDEFFDRALFASRIDFWHQNQTYWLYFNTARPNRNKNYQTPLAIIQQRNPRISPFIASFPVLDLGQTLALYSRRSFLGVGHDVPAPP
jgi:transposase